MVLLSLVIGVLGAEFLSRMTMPISPGTRNFTLDGDPLVVDYPGSYRYRPNLTYRQVSSEFDVRVTITSHGNRVPETTINPDTIFLGDSFTFGHGISDEQTFVRIYCLKVEISCTNLGRSGSGTGKEIDILEHYLNTESWRPREVKLFMLVMTHTLSSGNDLLDNLAYEEGWANRQTDNVTTPDGQPASSQFAVNAYKIRRWLLIRSNLARLTQFVFGPWLRARFSPRASQDKLKSALERTAVQLQRLDMLGRHHGFRYRIYLLHPMQDILLRTYEETAARLREVAPNPDRVVGTGELFMPDPLPFYYAYDGHLNAAGSAKVAEFLESERKQEEAANLNDNAREQE